MWPIRPPRAAAAHRQRAAHIACQQSSSARRQLGAGQGARLVARRAPPSHAPFCPPSTTCAALCICACSPTATPLHHKVSQWPPAVQQRELLQRGLHPPIYAADSRIPSLRLQQHVPVRARRATALLTTEPRAAAAPSSFQYIPQNPTPCRDQQCCPISC